MEERFLRTSAGASALCYETSAEQFRIRTALLTWGMGTQMIAWERGLLRGSSRRAVPRGALRQTERRRALDAVQVRAGTIPKAAAAARGRGPSNTGLAGITWPTTARGDLAVRARASSRRQDGSAPRWAG